MMKLKQMSETINCFNYDFLCHPSWGHVHDKPTPRANCWYDPLAITTHDNGMVDLNILHHLAVFDYNQKNVSDEWIVDGKFKEGADKLLCAEYGVGMLWSVQPFSFGTYILKAKLPKGNYLWPAFWLFTATPNRPEEIDILEGYSEETGYKVMKGLCRKVFDGWNLRNCIHTGDNSLPKYPAIYPTLSQFNVNPSEEYVEYKLVWEHTAMLFYVNNVLVRAIFDKAVLDNFIKYPYMHVVINTHIDGRFYKKFNIENVTPLRILSFEYYAGNNR